MEKLNHTETEAQRYFQAQELLRQSAREPYKDSYEEYVRAYSNFTTPENIGARDILESEVQTAVTNIYKQVVATNEDLRISELNTFLHEVFGISYTFIGTSYYDLLATKDIELTLDARVKLRINS